MKSLSLMVKIIQVLCGIWNLDFFRHIVPPFCVSSHLNNIQALSLDYIHIVYPFLLILFTFSCIELHARNFRPIILLWKPFHGIVTRLRRSWDPRASIINAISTFLLLALSKSIVITYNSLAVTFLILVEPGPVRERHNSFLYVDPTIRAFSVQHLPYYISSILLLVILLGLPVLLLCLYPIKIFRKLLSCFLPLRWQQAVSAFMDTFQGHYKDGTNGTRDYRAASAIHLLVIFLIVWASAGRNRRPYLLGYMQPALVVVSLFYALARPYRQYCANIIQSLLYALIALTTFLMSYVKSDNKHIGRYFLPMFLCLFVPHVLLGTYVLYKFISRTTRPDCFCYHESLSKLVPFQRIMYMCTHHSFYPNEQSSLISSS